MDSYFSKYHGINICVGDHLEIGKKVIYQAEVKRFYADGSVELKFYKRAGESPINITQNFDVSAFEENGFQLKILNNKKFDKIIDEKYKNLYI